MKLFLSYQKHSNHYIFKYFIFSSCLHPFTISIVQPFFVCSPLQKSNMQSRRHCDSSICCSLLAYSPPATARSSARPPPTKNLHGCCAASRVPIVYSTNQRIRITIIILCQFRCCLLPNKPIRRPHRCQRWAMLFLEK